MVLVSEKAKRRVEGDFAEQLVEEVSMIIGDQPIHHSSPLIETLLSHFEKVIIFKYF